MNVAEKASSCKTELVKRSWWGLSSLISGSCIIMAIGIVIVFHLGTSFNFISQVAIPLVIGLGGAVAGIFAKNPLLTGLNLGLGFFLVPAFLFFFGSVF